MPSVDFKHFQLSDFCVVVIPDDFVVSNSQGGELISKSWQYGDKAPGITLTGALNSGNCIVDAVCQK